DGGTGCAAEHGARVASGPVALRAASSQGDGGKQGDKRYDGFVHVISRWYANTAVFKRGTDECNLTGPGRLPTVWSRGGRLPWLHLSGVEHAELVVAGRRHRAGSGRHGVHEIVGRLYPVVAGDRRR